MSFNVWEGIYKDFKECPSEGDGFEGNTWVSRSAAKIKEFFDMREENKSTYVGTDGLLPFLVAVFLSTHESIRILDFGGGLGSTYINVISNCISNRTIDYHIVESNRICEMGRDIFKEDGRVHFYTSLPDAPASMDIVYLCSSIQYVEDWKTVIEKLLSYNAPYLLMEDLTAGSIPTFVTVQNYYESRIPCYFFNIGEITDLLSSLNYKLLFASAHNGVYFGKPSRVPLDNFPDKYRIDNTCNLLFQKEQT